MLSIVLLRHGCAGFGAARLPRTERWCSNLAREEDKRISYKLSTELIALFDVRFSWKRISLKSRAANQSAWESISYCCRGAIVERRYKTFLATSHIAGGCVRDVKEVWGAGQQQVRNVWSSTGTWNLCGWLNALVELETWVESRENLVDRSDRPWDNPNLCLSHNDRHRKIAGKMLSEVFLNDLQTAINQ